MLERKSLALIAMILLESCSSNSFKGGTPTAAPAPAPATTEMETIGSQDSQPEPKPEPELEPVVTEEKVSCDPSKLTATEVKLLETSPSPIRLHAEGTFIFEVSLRSCKDGASISLENQDVFFDIDAYLEEVSAAYVASDSKTKAELKKGSFAGVFEDQDLFGHKQLGFWYMKMEGFSMPATKNSFTMAITVPSIESPRVPALGGFDVFLRVGDSQPAKAFIKLGN